MAKLKPDTEQMRLLADAGFQLIPLHGYWETRVKAGKRRELGKAPLDRGWTTQTYCNERVLRDARTSGRNVGVRLRSTDLVVDVDPRAIDGGILAARRKLVELGVDLEVYPTVATGSGGFHIYMSKTGNLIMRDHLPGGWRGIEFKSLGRQVVAPGSIHPNRGTYAFVSNHFDIDDLWLGAPSVPPQLLAAGKRPNPVTRSSTTVGRGTHSPEEIATILGHMDVEDFRDHDTWLRFMMSIHHASDGEAIEEFVEWCEGDPSFVGHGANIRYRWSSLRRHGIGLGTLYMFMKRQGCAHLVDRRPRVVTANEFAGAQ